MKTEAARWILAVVVYVLVLAGALKIGELAIAAIRYFAE